MQACGWLLNPIRLLFVDQYLVVAETVGPVRASGLGQRRRRRDVPRARRARRPARSSRHRLDRGTSGALVLREILKRQRPSRSRSKRVASTRNTSRSSAASRPPKESSTTRFRKRRRSSRARGHELSPRRALASRPLLARLGDAANRKARSSAPPLAAHRSSARRRREARVRRREPALSLDLRAHEARAACASHRVRSSSFGRAHHNHGRGASQSRVAVCALGSNGPRQGHQPETQRAPSLPELDAREPLRVRSRSHDRNAHPSHARHSSRRAAQALEHRKARNDVSDEQRDRRARSRGSSDGPLRSASRHATALLVSSRRAMPLSHFATSQKPVTLIVPDGTWRNKLRRCAIAFRAFYTFHGVVAARRAVHYRLRSKRYRMVCHHRSHRTRNRDLGGHGVRREIRVFSGQWWSERSGHAERWKADVTNGVPEGAMRHDPVSGVSASFILGEALDAREVWARHLLGGPAVRRLHDDLDAPVVRATLGRRIVGDRILGPRPCAVTRSDAMPCDTRKFVRPPRDVATRSC